MPSMDYWFSQSTFNANFSPLAAAECSKNPFFRDIFSFLASLFHHHPPRSPSFLHQDFLLSRVLVILVFLLHPLPPQHRIYALQLLWVRAICRWHQRGEWKENVVDDAREMWSEMRKENLGWAMCSGHMWCFILLIKKFMLFQTLSSRSSRLFNNGKERGEEKF